MVATISGVLGYAGTSGALPTHAADDTIIGFAFRDGSNVAPTAPTNFGSHPWHGNGTPLDFGGGSSASYSMDYFVCTGSSHDSGTWVNATCVMFLCVTGADTTDPIGNWTEANANGSIVTYGGVSMQVTDGTSRVLGLVGCRLEGSNLANPPSGMTNIYASGDFGTGSTTGALAAHQTTSGVSGWSSTTAGITNGNTWWSVALEILAPAGGGGGGGSHVPTIMQSMDQFNGGMLRHRRPSLVQVRWPGLLTPKRPRLILPSDLKKAA